MTTICVLSWNCGNKSPSDGDLAHIISEIFQGQDTLSRSPLSLPRDIIQPKYPWPDILAIGLQEAAREGARWGVLGGESLTPRLLRKLNENPSTRDKYVKLTSSNMAGLTKPGQENPNTQYLGVFCRKDRGFEAEKGQYKDSSSGKGGLFCKIGFNQAGYGTEYYTFITSHLDSNSDEKRNKQISELMNKTELHRSKMTFFFGDLNFRLDVYKVSPYMRRDTKELAKAILNPLTREILWNADKLPEHCALKTQYEFNFPRPKPILFYPSYKHSMDYPAESQIIGNCNPEDNESLNPTIVHAAQRCFFDGLPVVQLNKKREGDLPIGWLDRIGYRCNYGQDIGGIHYFRDLPKLTMSDHKPVVMQYSTIEEITNIFDLARAK